MYPRIGVFICNCGDEVSQAIETAAVRDFAASLPGVIHSNCLHRACSPDGLSAIQDAVRNHKLEQALVAGCTPRLIGKHFRTCLEEAGIDRSGFEMVDIREGCAWVHHDQAAATAKAFDLLQMGHVRLSQRAPRQFPVVAVKPLILILGGGLAGMTAALTIAEEGGSAVIVEREAELGGALHSAHTILPDRRPAHQVLAEIRDLVAENERISVLLRSRLASIHGSAGSYAVEIQRLEPPGGSMRHDVGAIIIATGAQSTQRELSGSLLAQDSCSQAEFEHMLKVQAANGRSALPSDVVMAPHLGLDPRCTRSVVDHANATALKQALDLMEISPATRATVLITDPIVDPSSLDARFFDLDNPSRLHIMLLSSDTPLRSHDGILHGFNALHGEGFRIPCDLLVVGSSLIPREGADALACLLKIPTDSNGFFLQVRPPLRPERNVDTGMYVCGAAHGPCNQEEAQLQAVLSAYQALRFVRAGQALNLAPIAFVDEGACTGCGTCASSCAFNAISFVPTNAVLDRAVIDPLACRGCGSCLVVCPVKAISQESGSDVEMLGQIEAALSHRSPDGNPMVLVFGCEWSGNAAAEIAGRRRFDYPSGTRVMRMDCAARFDPLHALWAFINGADGIVVGACRAGECHYLSGNLAANKRYQSLQRSLAYRGFDPRRMQFIYVDPDHPESFIRQIREFSDFLDLLVPADQQVLID